MTYTTYIPDGSNPKTFIPQGTTVVQREDFRFYPVVVCTKHPGGIVLLSRKGHTVSYRAYASARRYLLRTFGSAVVCPVHGAPPRNN